MPLAHILAPQILKKSQELEAQLGHAPTGYLQVSEPIQRERVPMYEPDPTRPGEGGTAADNYYANDDRGGKEFDKPRKLSPEETKKLQKEFWAGADPESLRASAMREKQPSLPPPAKGPVKKPRPGFLAGPLSPEDVYTERGPAMLPGYLQYPRYMPHAIESDYAPVAPRNAFEAQANKMNAVLRAARIRAGLNPDMF